MSGGTRCKCAEQRKPVRERRWSVFQYRANCSAFNGYRTTVSRYSALVCEACGAHWRTKGDYVEALLGRRL